MSQIYVSGLLIVLSQFLPLIGVNLGSDDLTKFAQIVIAIAGGIWIIIRRHKQGDITAAGTRK